MPIIDVSMTVSTTSPRRLFPLKRILALADALINSSRPARERGNALPSTTRQWLKEVGLVLAGGRLETQQMGWRWEKHSVLYIVIFQANLSTG